MRTVRLTGAVIGMTPLLLAALVGSAAADAPTKSGWWNAATANGVALPMPTTGAGDLHVSQGPTSPTAYAAVGYELAGQAIAGATLRLKVTANSTVGTIDVMACPTKDATWKAGDDQAYDTAPAYDCAAGSRGLVSADGTAVTFLLDAGQLLAGTAYSLAVVPTAGATPFSADFAKPDATSLDVELAPTEQPAAVAPAPAPAALPPPKSGVSGSAPLSPGSTIAVAPAPALQAPAVAVPAVPEPQPAVAPQAAAPAAAPVRAEPVSNRVRYEAGTLLALIAGGLVWAFQQQTPQPRLIGGMARKAPPTAAVPVDATPRGIGRFASARTAPARRLV
jgi:hypothetical protein